MLLNKDYRKRKIKENILLDALKLDKVEKEARDEKPGLTRGELKKITGMPRTSIFDIIINMISSGRVKKERILICHRGRPRIRYVLVE